MASRCPDARADGTDHCLRATGSVARRSGQWEDQDVRFVSAVTSAYRRHRPSGEKDHGITVFVLSSGRSVSPARSAPIHQIALSASDAYTRCVPSGVQTGFRFPRALTPDAIINGITRRGARKAAAVADTSPVPADSASSISSRASAASASLCPRSFARHRRSSLRIEAGVLVGSVVQSGSSFNTEASTCGTVSPWKA